MVFVDRINVDTIKSCLCPENVKLVSQIIDNLVIGYNVNKISVTKGKFKMNMDSVLTVHYTQNQFQKLSVGEINAQIIK